MPKTYNAKPIRELGEFTTANNGDMIVFGLRFGVPGSEPEPHEYFALPYDTLSVFMAALLEAGGKANALREKNPLHAAGHDAGFALKLENGAVGPSSKHKGEHVLECVVGGPAGGTLKYLIRADRQGLETLRDLLAWYLDTPAGRGERSTLAH